MKCWSRSTLGVVIGILSVLLYICVTIITCGSLHALQTKFDEIFDSDTKLQNKEVLEEFSTLLLSTVLAASLVMIIISGVLIMGIVKRRHKLMMPWLVLSAFGFVCDCGRILLMLILGIVKGHDFSMVLGSFVIGVLGVGIEALILWLIYTLWRDIRKNNVENPGRVIDGVHYETAPVHAPPQCDFYNNLPQKS